jgi:hypothetical protein
MAHNTEYCYAESRIFYSYAGCCNAKWHYAECRGAVTSALLMALC